MLVIPGVFNPSVRRKMYMANGKVNGKCKERNMFRETYSQISNNFLAVNQRICSKPWTVCLAYAYLYMCFTSKNRNITLSIQQKREPTNRNKGRKVNILKAMSWKTFTTEGIFSTLSILVPSIHLLLSLYSFHFSSQFGSVRFG